MLSNNIFRISLLISVSVHALLVSPWHGISLFQKVKEIKKDVEICYVVPKEKDSLVQEMLPKEYDLKDKDLSFSGGKDNKKKDSLGAPQEADSHPLDWREEATDAFSKELSENMDEYIQYYELIRERIKKRVLKRHDSIPSGGEVGVSFELDSSGMLKHLNRTASTSAADDALVGLALRSIEESAPFPAFPETLKKNSLTFNLTIVFEK